VNFPTIDALERELRRLEASSQLSRHHDIPPDPVAFALEVGIAPDPWQREVLDLDHPRKILCCGRQTGKSTVAAILSIHKALTVPGSVVLIVAPAEKQAKWLFRKVKAYYKQAGSPFGAPSDRATGLELGNGSIIEAMPAVERTGRGPSVNLLVVDEAAGVPDMDYYGILPALIATRGEQVLLSTPRGKRGFFHEIWHGGDDWLREMIRSDEVSRISTADLEVFRQSMPEQFFRQEFFCEWLDTEGGLFSHDDIAAALAAGEEVEALQIGDDEW
jgi:hypothetical protein